MTEAYRLDDALSMPLRRTRPVKPIKVVQFGTGAFVHGFIDWIVDRLNTSTGWNAGVASVKLRAGHSDILARLEQQEGLYHVNRRGVDDTGRSIDTLELIDCVQSIHYPHEDFAGFLDLAEQASLEWVVSNSTEAGLVYAAEPFTLTASASTFPGQLTQFLYQRYKALGDDAPQLLILPCELVDDNAAVLRGCIAQYERHWALEPDFSEWLESKVHFCATIVDRIVTGIPSRERSAALCCELGVEDQFIIETEHYHLWGIEASGGVAEALAERLEQSGLNVQVVTDLNSLREQKIRVLNGVHTATVLAARLMRVRTVRDAMQHDLLRAFMESYWYQAAVPSMPAFSDMGYVESIARRFENPFVEHEWQNIALNSFSKWRARLVPVLMDLLDLKEGRPEILLASLAILVELYLSPSDVSEFNLTDNAVTLTALQTHQEHWDGSQRAWQELLSDEALWGGQALDLPLRWIALLSDFSQRCRHSDVADLLTSLVTKPG